MLENFIVKSTKIAGFLIFIIVAAVSVQIVSRYGFNIFIREIVPLIQQSFAVFLLVGGVYITFKGEHIRVTVLYDLFGPKMKRFSKVLTLICMSVFLGVLIWQASWMGLNALKHKETMNGIYRFMPLYPLKLFIPGMAILILIVGVINFIKTWNDLEQIQSINKNQDETFAECSILAQCEEDENKTCGIHCYFEDYHFHIPWQLGKSGRYAKVSG